MRPTMTRRGGFTLIELMVVMIILAILAGVLIALVTSSKRDARRVSVQATAKEAQQAIARYREETGRLPNLIAGWDPLTRRTTVAGVTVGPYLSGPPQNLMVDGNPVCITDGDEPVLYTNVCSWLYDYDNGAGSGRFIASYDPAP
jgi:prepilin-type N-terminal cleavage/methylation domain-containing protein